MDDYFEEAATALRELQERCSRPICVTMARDTTLHGVMGGVGDYIAYLKSAVTDMPHCSERRSAP